MKTVPATSTAARLANIFAQLCAAADPDSPPDVFAFLAGHPAVSPGEAAEVICVDQKFRSGLPHQLSVEDYLQEMPEIAADVELKARLIVHEYTLAKRAGRGANISSILDRFPEVHQQVIERLKQAGFASDLRAEFEVTRVDESPLQEPMLGRQCQAGEALECTGVPALPKTIGRYEIRELIGEGGFGRVYLGYHQELGRRVAIKVPKHDLRLSIAAREKFLSEGRILASLDHSPGVVPVFDAGITDDGVYYVVSRFVDGCDLSELAQSRLSASRCAEIVADVAEGLQAAHEAHIVHRDVKPANILLDQAGRALVADFGIALQEERTADASKIVGTTRYASPEQSRGEGHLVDGRSDIFSLGVVFWELLTGTHPFDDQGGGGAQFQTVPPELDDADVPPELRRICQKALALRAADRYATAKEMADDLRHWLSRGDTNGLRRGAGTPRPRMLPKGLRCFDRENADFFLDLLPGRRERDGLPEVVGFWKQRIDGQTTPFRVGLISGPSGCGKSSLIHAGLIPRLDRRIKCESIVCSAHSTPAVLLSRLRQAFDDIPGDLDLRSTIRAIRKRLKPESGPKLLIVLDQFEQWLQHHRAAADAELINALRQCDGDHVQCIIVLRDDFWTQAPDLFRDLDDELRERHNLARMDSFSLEHAQHVLLQLGRSLKELPADQQLGHDQSAFLSQAVSMLARDGKVVPAHLILFVEVMRNQEWNLTSLERLDGGVDLGVAFLETSFASPGRTEYRQQAQSVLRCLLPSESSDMRGRAKSGNDLLQAAGLTDHPGELNDLLDLLTTELNLIDPAETPSERSVSKKTTHYELTHDLLVPAIRNWLALGRTQTQRERAEIRLAERANWWSVRPETSSLPSWWEWLSIELLVPGAEKNQDSKRKSMLGAARHYFFKATVAMVSTLLLLGSLAFVQRQRSVTRTLVGSLETARTAEALGIADRLAPQLWWAESSLTDILADSQTADTHRLHAQLALLPSRPELASVIATSVVDLASSQISSAELIAIRDWLDRRCAGDDAHVIRALAKRMHSQDSEARRFRAGVALAAFQDSAHSKAEFATADSAMLMARFMVDDIARNPENAAVWTSGLEPIKHILVEPLERIFRKEADGDPEMAALFLSNYLSDGAKFVDLLLESSPEQQTIMLPTLERHRGAALAALTVIVETDDPPAAGAKASLSELQRRAGAAALLCELGSSQHLPAMLAAKSDPTQSTYLVERLGELPDCATVLIDQLKATASPATRALIIQAIGGVKRPALAKADQDRCVDAIRHVFHSDPNAGVHSAAEWFLLKWGESDSISATFRLPHSNDRDWYTSSRGHSMVVVHGPVVSVLGGQGATSQLADADLQISRTIDRTFAIGAKEVTISQFLECFDELELTPEAGGLPDRPISMVWWHQAAGFCNWLSEQEGMPPEQWCYRPTGDGSQTMIPHDDYLTRRGYRLPTEAEWELACRAGSTTAFSWGADATSADEFAWSSRNSRDRKQPVGHKRPNRFGLFDMHGNVAEWLHDSFLHRHEMLDSEVDVEHPAHRNPSAAKVVRGGSVADPTVASLRSFVRLPHKPTSGAAAKLGFRIARTLALHPQAPSADAPSMQP